MDAILPDPHILELVHLHGTTREIVAVVAAKQTTSPCPLCQRASGLTHETQRSN